MNKSIRVVITSIITIAVFLTAGLTWEACQTKTKTKPTEEAVSQEGGDDFFEDEFETDDSYESSDSETTSDFSDVNTSEPNEYENIEDKASSSNPVEETTSYEETPPVRRATTKGKYLIVAGNFLVESNATKMVNKLVSLGYNSAEVAIFDYSQYYTVIATRTDDYSLANSLSAQIKGKGVDSYVHTSK